MKLLLMGGTGWLGHHIALQLEKAGVPFTILTRGKKAEFKDVIDRVPTIIADKKDDAAMKEVFKTRYTHIIDTVPTLESIASVKKYATSCEHYIHCSSTGGYAPLPFVPCNETAFYKGFARGTGWDKKRIYDETVMEMYRKEGFPVTVIRPCYITGPGMLPLDNFGGRREDFIRDIVNEAVLDVPDDGQALLQPIHVYDLATSFVLSLTHPRSIGQIYNICLDYAFPLNRYLEITASVFGKKPVINYMKLADMQKKHAGKIDEIGLNFLSTHMCFDIVKACRDLDYKPHCSPEDAVEETALWAAETTGVKF
ncbi:MAG: NAD-dependent epimerase/dehydratase family protein [Victivallaceae bacterium]|nr:NAD-dependent epimerase/dehydratase family protein [Victivallaceae bacterium]